MSTQNQAVPNLDDVRDFWNRRPCNVRHSNAPFLSREYFDQVEARKYFVEPHIPGFADFDSWAEKKVLEIGLGIGTDAINFARSKAKYTGIELSQESLNIAVERFKVYQLEGRLQIGNAEDFAEDFTGEVFDLVYSFGVLHHTPNLQKSLLEISKVSNKNTVVKIMLYARNSIKQNLIDAGLEQPEAQYGCPIANSYDRDEVVNIFKDSGLEVVKIEQDHIFPFVIDDYKNYKYTYLPYYESMPRNVFRVLEKSFGWHLLIEARLS